MCHNNEILTRIDNFQVDDFELISNIFPNQAMTKTRPMFTSLDDEDTKKKTERSSTLPIKIYYRSSADKDMSDPDTVRPPFVLYSTIKYLMSVIADCNYGDDMGKYLFIANRLRSVRQDFTVLFSKNPDFRSLKKTIESFELMVLAYLTFLNRLRRDDKHDEKTLLDHFSESLNILMHCYSHRENHLKQLQGAGVKIIGEFCFQSNRRADFMAMDLILHLFINSTGYIRRLSQFSGLVKNFFEHPKIKLVLQIQNSLESHNYNKYFKIMNKKDFIWHSFLNFWEFLFRVRLMIHSTSGFIKSKSTTSEGRKAEKMMLKMHLESNEEFANLGEFFDGIDEKFLIDFDYQNKKDILYKDHMADIGNEKTKLKKFSSLLIDNKFHIKSKWFSIQEFYNQGLMIECIMESNGSEIRNLFEQSEELYKKFNKTLLLDKTIPIGQTQEPEKKDSKTEEVVPNKDEKPESENTNNMTKKFHSFRGNEPLLSLKASEKSKKINEDIVQKRTLNNTSLLNPKNLSLFSNEKKLEKKGIFNNLKPIPKLSFENMDAMNNANIVQEDTEKKEDKTKPQIPLNSASSNKINEMNSFFLNANKQANTIPEFNGKHSANNMLNPKPANNLNSLEVENSKNNSFLNNVPSSLQNQINTIGSNNIQISENTDGINPLQIQSGTNAFTNNMMGNPQKNPNNFMDINNSAPPSKKKTNPFITAKSK